LIENVTLRNTPFWNVHPVFCKNVTLRGLNIEKGTTNDDGLDPDSCTDVLIENCTINTNDDAISIKAGRDQDAWDRLPSENIIVRNNNLTSGVNGFCIGSEMSGGVRNIFVYDNIVPKARRGINFKCNLDRGGQVEKIYIKNMKLGTCTEELFIFRMDYHGYRGNNYPTKFNDFFVTDISCDNVEGTAFKIVGVEDQHIQRVYLSDFEIKNTAKDFEIKYADEIVFNNIIIGGEVWDIEY
jgi:polygalacturonase